MDLTSKQKEYITYIYNKTITPPKSIDSSNLIIKSIQNSQHYNSYVLVSNLLQKIGFFYEELFAYLCNLTRPSKTLCDLCTVQKSNHLRNFCNLCNRRSFDLIDTNTFIELKSSFQTVIFDRTSYVNHLGKFNPQL